MLTIDMVRAPERGAYCRARTNHRRVAGLLGQLRVLGIAAPSSRVPAKLPPSARRSSGGPDHVGAPRRGVWHDFLSKKSRAEATMIFGRLSAFRLDVNDRRILQTDAPHLVGKQRRTRLHQPRRDRGFSHLHFHVAGWRPGDPGVQLPHPGEFDARPELAVGLTPRTDSPFTRAWDQGIEAHVEDHLCEALVCGEAADQLVPGLIDVRRAIARIRDRFGEKP